MRLIRTFLKMPLKQKLLIPQVFVLMAYYKNRVHKHPFAELAPKIGHLGHETPFDASPRNAWLVHELMESMFRHIGWKDSCLIRALTAKKLLNRMGGEVYPVYGRTQARRGGHDCPCLAALRQAHRHRRR